MSKARAQISIVNTVDGTNYYTHIRYSANSNGSGFVTTPTSATKYIGVYSGASATAPTSNTSYTWSKFIGDTGADGTNFTWNMLRCTNNIVTSTGISENTWKLYSGGDGTGTVIDLSTDYSVPVVTGYKISNNTSGNRDIQQSVKLIKGETYTASGYVKVDSASAVQWRIWNNTTNKAQHAFKKENFEVSTSWQKVTWTFTYSGETSDLLNMAFGCTGACTGISICAMKLEKSSTATEWTPHPDDIKGADGNGINSVTYLYKATTTNTPPSATDSGWQASPPTLSATNKYVWFKQTIDYTDSSVSDTATVGLYGTYVTNGSSVTIKSNSVTYQTSTSGTVTPTGTWGNSVPEVAGGEYLWTKTVVSYSDNTTTTSYSVSYKGIDGESITVKSSKQEYIVLQEDVARPLVKPFVTESGVELVDEKGNEISTMTWLDSIPVLNSSDYLWTKITTNYSDGSSTETYIVTKQGDDGTGLSTITEEYYLSNSKTELVGGAWTTTQPTWSSGMCLWTRSKIVYKNPVRTEYSTPVCDSSWEAIESANSETQKLATQTAQDIADKLNAELNERLNAESARIDSTNSKLNNIDSALAKVNTSIDDKNKELKALITKVLEDYKAEVGQYMVYDSTNGLQLGAQDSKFKTIIDNQALRFTEDRKTVATINNSNLVIPDAVIENTLTIGKYFFSPLEDGGISITWQE